MKKILNKVKYFFLDHINFCHETLSSGEVKKPTLFYKLFCWAFWPLARWAETDDERFCWCCTAVRGIIYGWISMFVVMYLVWRIF